jgi:hypothetical protein
MSGHEKASQSSNSNVMRHGSLPRTEIARRLEASQHTEIKAEHVHLFDPHDDVQPVWATKDKRLQFGINLPCP